MPAFTVKQSVGVVSSGSQASVTTAGITTTTGNLLVAIPIAFGNVIGGTPNTDSLGNTWVQAIASTGNTRGWSAMYYCNGATGGAGHTFTFTATGSDFLALVVFEIQGAAAASVLGSTSTDVSSTSSHNSGSITATGVDQIFIGTCALSAVGSVSAYSPHWWSRSSQVAGASNEGFFSAWREVSAGDSDSFAVTTTFSGRETIMIAGFKSAAGGGGGGGSFDTQQRLVGAGLLG